MTQVESKAKIKIGFRKVVGPTTLTGVTLPLETVENLRKIRAENTKE